jgi:hypothetical protein
LENEEFVAGSEVVRCVTHTLTQSLWPSRLARSLVLAQRESFASNSQALLAGKNKVQFNADMCAALEAQLSGGANAKTSVLSAMASAAGSSSAPATSMGWTAFSDCMGQFLGDDVALTLVQTLAASNSERDAPSEVLCTGFAKYGFGYVRELSHALALAEESNKEAALDQSQEDFFTDFGELEIVSFSPVEGTKNVKIVATSTIKNVELAELVFDKEQLSEQIGVQVAFEKASEGSDERTLTDPAALEMLRRYLFLDHSNVLVLHVPLSR